MRRLTDLLGLSEASAEDARRLRPAPKQNAAGKTPAVEAVIAQTAEAAINHQPDRT